LILFDINGVRNELRLKSRHRREGTDCNRVRAIEKMPIGDCGWSPMTNAGRRLVSLLKCRESESIVADKATVKPRSPPAGGNSISGTVD